MTLSESNRIDESRRLIERLCQLIVSDPCPFDPSYAELEYLRNDLGLETLPCASQPESGDSTVAQPTTVQQH
jgi:hypothetical protein